MVVWEQYDPSWLIKLASRQLPPDHWIIAASRECVECTYGEQEIFFIDPQTIEDDGYMQNILLSDPPNSGVWIVATQDQKIFKIRPGWSTPK